MKDDLTFNDFPVVFKMAPNDDVYVYCKGVVGLLSEGDRFLKHRKNGEEHTFGGRQINQIDDLVQIDCLTDTRKRFKEIAKLAKEFKDKEILKTKQK